jgi:REP element-mobilizing transposase RayT
MARNREKLQLGLELVPTFDWGGARDGAGRKPTGAAPRIAHRPRDVGRRLSVHVTLRARAGVPSLRFSRSFGVVTAALRGLRGRDDFRVVHYSVLANHLHLIVETEGPEALGRAMRALSIRLSRRLNALRGARGRALEDRYHAHPLRTPTEVRRAVAYVLGNFASHARRRGDYVPEDFVDPCSSAAPVGLDGLPPAVDPPHTWLLAKGGGVREPDVRYAAA